MIESSRRDAETRSGWRQGRNWLVRWKGACDFKDSRPAGLLLFYGKVQLTSAGVFKICQKLLENWLDLWDGKGDITCSMPAEPLGFSGNLMLNSGGFFYVWTRFEKEVGHD